jgi:hypothetical protein
MDNADDASEEGSVSSKRKGYQTDTTMDAKARRRERDRLRKQEQRKKLKALMQQKGDKGSGRPQTTAGKDKKKAEKPYDHSEEEEADDLLYTTNWGSDDDMQLPSHIPGFTFPRAQPPQTQTVPPVVPSALAAAEDRTIAPPWVHELQESIRNAFAAANAASVQCSMLQNQTVAALDTIVQTVQHLSTRMEALQRTIYEQSSTPRFTMREVQSVLDMATRFSPYTDPMRQQIMHGPSFFPGTMDRGGTIGDIQASAAPNVPVPTQTLQATSSNELPGTSQGPPVVVAPAPVQNTPSMEELFKEFMDLKRRMLSTAQI